MSVVESSPGFSPDRRSQSAEQLASVHKLRPQQNEDVFLLEQEPLPTFPGIAVESAPTKRRRDLDTPHANYYERQVTLSDGTRFPDLIGVAVKPVSDVPVVKVPAWWTSIYKGFNKDTTDRLNRMGRHTYTKGIATNRALSLYRNSWDVQVALDDVAVDLGAFQADVIDEEGDSNGAMTGIGIMAYNPEFARTTRAAFLVDACLVTKIGKPEVKKLLLHPEYAAREIACLLRQGRRLAKDEEVNLREMARTVEFSKDYVLGNFLLSRGLFWGELGHLAAHVESDQQGHNYLFNHSIFNQKRRLIQTLKGSDQNTNARPGMTHETHTGTHLSIANPRTIDAKIGYFAALQPAA